MKNIVGKKLLAIVTMAYSLCLHAQITLQIRDQNGRAVEQVLAGSPFTVEVALDGVHGGARNPEVEGLQQFMSAGRQTRIQTINGKTTASYLYTLTADKPGEYRIGPAWIVHDGKKVTSVPVQVSVVDRADELEEVYDQDIEPVIVRLKTDKPRAVVGEAIQFRLQLLYRDDSIVIKEIRQPQWAAATVEGPFETPRRIEKIDGVPYQQVEWVWHVYPTKAGRFVVPAQALDYQVPVEDQAGHLGMFSLLFRQAYKTKRVYSNAVTVEVDPLPAHDGVVNAIGSFSRFNAELKPPVAKQSEGMVLLLSVDRWGASNPIKAPVLERIPNAVRSYDSKQYSIDHHDGSYTDCFEYILQGIKPSSWELPAQQFTFFDVVSRRYVTLASTALLGTILPSTADEKKTDIVPTEHNNEPAASASHESEAIDAIAPLDEKGLWYRKQSLMIPWWLFIILLCTPLAYVLAHELKKRVPSYWLRKMPFINQKKAFTRARAALQGAQKRGAVSDLYSIFMNLFVDRFMMSNGDNRTDQILAHLEQVYMSREDIGRWRTFWRRIEELHFFSAARLSGSEQSSLFTESRNWLNELEKLL